jgi:hypothetical protein
LNNGTTGETGSNNNGMFLFMMMLWSFCLAYFFGFFGISFVDKEALEESPSSFGLNELDAQLNTINRQRQQANNSKTATPSTSGKHRPVIRFSSFFTLFPCAFSFFLDHREKASSASLS